MRLRVSVILRLVSGAGRSSEAAHLKMHRRRCAAALGCLALVAGQTDPTACAWAAGGTGGVPGASFSACSIVNSNNIYAYTSPIDMQTHNATYYFNIGANVLPVASGPSGVCLNNNPAAAYQVIPPGGQYSGCYELTADFGVRNLYTRSLFDAANPARGWQIRASGGSSQYCGSARSFTWIFMCDKTNPTPPLQSNNYTFVEEIAGCQYAAFMYSQVGCPLECPRTAKGVCNNQGVCGYDWSAQTARCYCNSGYNVADCSATTSAPSGGAIFAALGGGSVIGALGILAYSYFAYRGKAVAVAAADGFYPS